MKKYIKPVINMMVINTKLQILAASGGVESGDNVGKGYNKNDVTYGNGGSLWDDEEED